LGVHRLQGSEVEKGKAMKRPKVRTTKAWALVDKNGCICPVGFHDFGLYKLRGDVTPDKEYGEYAARVEIRALPVRKVRGKL
jgi:hypothetical protein